MNQSRLAGYLIGAGVCAIVLYHTWHFIILGLALLGVWCLCHHHNPPKPPHRR
jgi:hypothetical protein